MWERWQLEEFLQARKRVCHVSNVCWANGRLTMCISLRSNLRRRVGDRCPARYLPELASDYSWPQSTPEGFRAEGWDGMLHLHAFEKVRHICLGNSAAAAAETSLHLRAADVDKAAVGCGRHRQPVDPSCWYVRGRLHRWPMLRVTRLAEKSHIPEGFTFADDALGNAQYIFDALFTVSSFIFLPPRHCLYTGFACLHHALSSSHPAQPHTAACSSFPAQARL
jgi:hypothetical protein